MCLISCILRLITNVSDSSLRNPPQESDTSIIYSILQHFKVNQYFPEQILSKLLPFTVIYIYAIQHQMQTELHRFIYIFLNPVLMQFNMDTFLNHMSNSHLHYLRATITFSKVVVTKKVRFKSKV